MVSVDAMNAVWLEYIHRDEHETHHHSQTEARDGDDIEVTPELLFLAHTSHVCRVLDLHAF